MTTEKQKIPLNVLNDTSSPIQALVAAEYPYLQSHGILPKKNCSISFISSLLALALQISESESRTKQRYDLSHDQSIIPASVNDLKDQDIGFLRSDM